MKLVIGAGATRFAGWVSTDKSELDITSEDSWQRLIDTHGRPQKVLSEHVWEHLLPADAEAACRNLFKFMAAGGMARIAVPDGLHPSADYINYVAPPSLTHIVLYDYESLSSLFLDTGFTVRLIEWWDKRRHFNRVEWSSEDGFVSRSLLHDHRNADGKPNLTSVIIDCAKP